LQGIEKTILEKQHREAPIHKIFEQAFDKGGNKNEDQFSSSKELSPTTLKNSLKIFNEQSFIQ